MITFQYSNEDERQAFDGLHAVAVTMSTSAISVDNILDDFKCFLQAAGFSFREDDYLLIYNEKDD